MSGKQEIIAYFPLLTLLIGLKVGKTIISDSIYLGHNDLFNTIGHIQKSTPIALTACALWKAHIYSLD